MSKESVLVPGSIVVTGLPDLACFTTFKDLLNSLPNYLSVRIPKSITNVIISNVQPLESERDVIWFRQNNAGTFLGIYVFSNGTWQQMFPPPQGIFKMYGDSRNVPEGYLLADENNPAFPASTGLFLKQFWKLSADATYYVVFEVTFTGL